MWRAATAAVIATLAVSSAAQAAADRRPITRGAALAQSILAARQFWSGWTPKCGAPEIAVVKLDRAISGLAEFDTCRIDLQAALVASAPRSPGGFYNLCQTVAHEWGHEVLGPTYFAATNPSDSGHSSNPDSVMAARPRATTPQCLWALNGARYRLDRNVRRTRVEIDGHACRISLGPLLLKHLSRCVNSDPAQALM
jgi:hypothetical protein